MSTQRHARSGFSLIEIMIVIGIIGLFMGMAAPALYKQFDKAKKSNAKTALNSFKTAIQNYYDETYQYPRMLKDLIKAPSDEKVAKKWNGSYLTSKKSIPKDPWGKEYQYRVNEGNTENPYELFSYGGTKGKSEPKANNISVWDEE